MNFPSRDQVERFRERYPVGCRVRLTQMDDAQAPPVGTEGTVRGVDDAGNLMVDWDNGSGLNVVLGEDEVIKLRDKRICPICGKEYEDVPALSRIDNKTLICPDCGTRQALASIGADKKKQDQVLDAIHKALDS